jgi:hypothetical protein
MLNTGGLLKMSINVTVFLLFLFIFITISLIQHSEDKVAPTLCLTFVRFQKVGLLDSRVGAGAGAGAAGAAAKIFQRLSNTGKRAYCTVQVYLSNHLSL